MRSVNINETFGTGNCSVGSSSKNDWRWKNRKREKNLDKLLL